MPEVNSALAGSWGGLGTLEGTNVGRKHSKAATARPGQSVMFRYLTPRHCHTGEGAARYFRWAGGFQGGAALPPPPPPPPSSLTPWSDAQGDFHRDAGENVLETPRSQLCGCSGLPLPGLTGPPPPTLTAFAPKCFFFFFFFFSLRAVQIYRPWGVRKYLISIKEAWAGE